MGEIMEIDEHLRPDSKKRIYSDAERLQMCEDGLAAMATGCSLSSAALLMGVSAASLLKWLRDDLELERRYEELKVVRSRALIEHSLHEMQTNTNWKLAESRARIYMRLAALLNPAEFSERAQVMAGKNLGVAKSVSFVLNMIQPSEQRGELTVVAQPKDGELP